MKPLLIFLGTLFPSQDRRTLQVGPGRAYSTLEEAHAAGRAGDIIEVFPHRYEGVALMVTKRNLTIRSAGGKRGENPPFRNPAGGDFRLSRVHAGITDAGRRVSVPGQTEPLLSWQYRHPQGREKRRAKRSSDLVWRQP